MITDELFANWMTAFATRLGVPIAREVLFAHKVTLDAELDDAAFGLACQRLYRDFDGFRFKAIPSPAEFVAAVRPKATPETDAQEAFSAILNSRTRTTTAETLGGAALRAYRAVGGYQGFAGLVVDDEPHLRRRFVQAYCEVAESTQHADGLALMAGEAAEVTRLARQVAAGLPAMPSATPRPRLVRGGGDAA